MTIGKFYLIHSLSLFYPVQMKCSCHFFRRKRMFLKKEAGYGRTFQFRLNVSVPGFGKKMPLPILRVAVFLGTGNCLPKSFKGAFCSNSSLDVREI